MKHLIICAVTIGLFFSFAVIPAIAKEPIHSFECMVESVLDGDTIKCAIKNSGGTIAKIRLYGIDAPEIEHINKKSDSIEKAGQSFGKESCDALNRKIGAHGIIHVDVLIIDRYKRLIGIITKGNQNINRDMVAEGWAWAYRQYLDRPYASEFIQAEEQARAKKMGLWQQNNPQPPWEFRKMQKKKGKLNDEG